MQTSIINYSEIKSSSHSYRLDAEFFDPRVLYNEELIKKNNYCYFSELIEEITGGATPLGANYPDNGIPFLRVQNIMQNYVDLSDVVFITEKDHNFLFRSQLKKYDVLTYFNIMGSSAILVGAVVSGAATKLANQIIVNLNIVALSEAMVLIFKMGVDPKKVMDAISSRLVASAILNVKAPMTIERNFKACSRININKGY